MSYLYIQENGCILSIDSGRLKIIYKDNMERFVPLNSIDNIVISGKISFSSNLLEQLLNKGIFVTFLSKKGNMFGRLESTSNINITKQRSQFLAQNDDNFNIAIAKRILNGKLKNQSVILRRYNKNIKSKEISEIYNKIIYYKKMILESTNIPQMIGYEGFASKNYFKGISLITKDNDIKFISRNRQPPKDEFNSLLSYGYTLLFYEVYNAIVLSGLNPYAGSIHQDRVNHPALASDLMEEWRAVIIDSMVLNAVSRNMFKKDDFSVEEKNGGVYLTKDANRKFVKLYEEKVRTMNNYIVDVKEKMSFRKSIIYQVSLINKAFNLNDPTIYKPVLIR